jgi:hypothetical protein
MTSALKKLKEMVIVKCLLSLLVQKETSYLHLSLQQNIKYLQMAHNSFAQKIPTTCSIPVRAATLQILLSSTQIKLCVG